MEIEELKNKKLCHHCVGDAFLSEEIRTQGKKLRCSYCSRVAKSYTMDELSERVDEVFDEHYSRTSDEPDGLQLTMLKDKESDYVWDRDGEPVLYAIMNAAEISEEAANDIQQILEDKYYDFDSHSMGEETEFSSDSHYEEIGADDLHWQEAWRDFEHSIRSEARFFSHTATNYLQSVFDGVDQMKTQDGSSLIVDAGPNTSLNTIYRARVFQSDGQLREALIRPDTHLGSPPSLYAKAGRMNAHGISVFYGANDPKVALAEVRPPVGSRVAVARFEILRDLRLLDLTALNKIRTIGSVFDPNFSERLGKAMFLGTLSKRIQKPVMPNDEPFEYIATQAIADFLATESILKLDGVIFPSVQTAGIALNIVLFHKAAKVEELELPEGTEVRTKLGEMTEDGWIDRYTVIEEVPPKQEKDREQSKTSPFDFLIDEEWEKQVFDPRPSTLKIDPADVMVHVIKAVEFSTKDHEVYRHRWEKPS